MQRRRERQHAGTTMPRGNRSISLRDPDGNLVNLFTPVTEDVIKTLREPTNNGSVSSQSSAHVW